MGGSPTRISSAPTPWRREIGVPRCWAGRFPATWWPPPGHAVGNSSSPPPPSATTPRPATTGGAHTLLTSVAPAASAHSASGSSPRPIRLAVRSSPDGHAFRCPMTSPVAAPTCCIFCAKRAVATTSLQSWHPDSRLSMRSSSTAERTLRPCSGGPGHIQTPSPWRRPMRARNRSPTRWPSATWQHSIAKSAPNWLHSSASSPPWRRLADPRRSTACSPRGRGAQANWPHRGVSSSQ